jgi:hypothetical protein
VPLLLEGLHLGEESDKLVLRTVKPVAKSRAKDRTPEGDDFPFFC